MPRSMSAVAATAALAVVGLAPGVAQAAILEAGSAPVDDTYVAATCTAPGGTEFDLVAHDVGVESWSVRARALTPYLPDVTEVRDISSTTTNEATGLSWTSTWRTRREDVRVLEVAGDDVTVQRALTGHFTAFAADGTQIDKQDSRIEYVVEVHTQGTADPSDDEEEFLGVAKGVGRNTVGDICEVALQHTFPTT